MAESAVYRDTSVRKRFPSLPFLRLSNDRLAVRVNRKKGIPSKDCIKKIYDFSDDIERRPCHPVRYARSDRTPSSVRSVRSSGVRRLEWRMTVRPYLSATEPSSDTKSSASNNPAFDMM